MRGTLGCVLFLVCLTCGCTAYPTGPMRPALFRGFWVDQFHEVRSLMIEYRPDTQPQHPSDQFVLNIPTDRQGIPFQPFKIVAATPSAEQLKVVSQLRYTTTSFDFMREHLCAPGFTARHPSDAQQWTLTDLHPSGDPAVLIATLRPLDNVGDASLQLALPIIHLRLLPDQKPKSPIETAVLVVAAPVLLVIGLPASYWYFRVQGDNP